MNWSSISKVKYLWLPAKVNPENGKALTIPVLNPYDAYGRVLWCSFIGFLVAFLSWFAFPPLMSTIKKDLGLTAAEVNNSNIVGLCSTLLARFILGPICDRYGPRIAMAFTLFVGAVPTAFVPLVSNISGIYAIRFFIGFLGGTFVPCSAWMAVFYDKPVVGLASALAAGWGNSGGGIAFFVMPAVMHALEGDGYTTHRAWRLSFDVCPFIIIMAIAALVLIFGPDCPEGKWSERTKDPETVEGRELASSDDLEAGEKGSGWPEEKSIHATGSHVAPLGSRMAPVSSRMAPIGSRMSSKLAPVSSRLAPVTTTMSRMTQIGKHELEPITDQSAAIEDPTFFSFLKTTFSPHTMVNALPYATTFGGELAVESIVSSLYAAHSTEIDAHWSSSLAANWGAMLGLLNVVFRPLGGYLSDCLYNYFKTPVVKKWWMLATGFLFGVFLLWVGLDKSISMPGLVVAMAFVSLFMEMANGANFSLVPHTNPHHTGIVAGTTGAFGNIGGVLFSLAFRFSMKADGSTNYMAALWYLGVAVMGTNALCVFLPLSKHAR